MSPTVDGFIRLFRGRADCYGSWEGGCVKSHLTAAHFQQHLTTGPHIGVYPSFNVDGVAHCVWGCADIDYDSYEEARLLQDAFDSVGVNAWTEKTRKGWHIWVFANELVPAEAMRNMFLACHQVTNLNPKEVNPKQTVLSHGQVGNYVRLPYPCGNAATERYIVTRDGNRMTLEYFVDQAVAFSHSADTIQELASYYTPPKVETVVMRSTATDMKQITDQLTALGWTIFQNGPLEGRDRSTTLAHLAHECSKSGIATGDALKLLEDADLRWGKYLMRGEQGMNELTKLVQRAYGVTLSS